MIPFQLVGADLVFCLPDRFALDHLLALVDACLGRPVACGRDRCRAFGAVSVTGKFSGSTNHSPAFEEQLRTIGERVFDTVDVEVLVNVFTAVMASSITLGFNWPDVLVFGVLHPAAFINVVDQEIAIATAAGPQECVEVADLVFQLILIGWLRPHKSRSCRARDSIGSQGDDFAQIAVLDPFGEFTAICTVATHQSDTDLQIFLQGFFVKGQHLASAGAVNGDGLFHEDVQAFFDGILEMDPAKSRWSCQDDNVTFL